MATSLAQITEAWKRLPLFRSLENRNFRWYWYNTSAQATGVGMQFLALGWLVLDLTDSSSRLGLVIFLYGVPNLALVLFGGILADRLDRRWLVFWSQILVVAVIVALATLSAFDWVKMSHLYGAAFALGVIQALNMPARMSLVADLVPREHIMNAVALNSAMMNSGRILGPAIAGGIIEIGGIGLALYVNAGFYGFGTLCLLAMTQPPRSSGGSGANVLRDLLGGLRYLWNSPVPLAVISTSFFMGFFAFPYVQILPAFAKEVLDTGAGATGLLLTAGGLGSLVGNLTLAALGNAVPKNRLLIGTALAFGVTLTLFAWSPWYWASWVILLFVGMVSMSFVAMGTTVLQLTTAAEFRGRVMSMWTSSAAVMFVGALPMGVVADAISWPVSMGGGALISLAFVFWLAVWRPALRRLEI